MIAEGFFILTFFGKLLIFNHTWLAAIYFVLGGPSWIFLGDLYSHLWWFLERWKLNYLTVFFVEKFDWDSPCSVISLISLICSSLFYWIFSFIFSFTHLISLLLILPYFQFSHHLISQLHNFLTPPCSQTKSTPKWPKKNRNINDWST